MVHFGQRLARERWAPWLPHYFDYDLLKRKLKAIKNAADQAEKDEAIQGFQSALDREIEKVRIGCRSENCLCLSYHGSLAGMSRGSLSH